jgi:hypothetical protein
MIWDNWLERRTRGWLLIWANFTAFLARHPLSVARIMGGEGGNALVYPANVGSFEARSAPSSYPTASRSPRTMRSGRPPFSG